MDIQNATDNARYVEWLNEHTFAVWKGGHTVNFYSYDRFSGAYNERVTAIDCINVGSFEKNSANLEEVKDGIESYELY